MRPGKLDAAGMALLAGRAPYRPERTAEERHIGERTPAGAQQPAGPGEQAWGTYIHSSLGYYGKYRPPDER